MFAVFVSCLTWLGHKPRSTTLEVSKLIITSTMRLPWLRHVTCYDPHWDHMCIMLWIVFANNNNLKTRFPSSFTQKMLLFLHTDSIFYKLRLQDHWGSKCLHTNVGCNEIELINCILKHQEGKCNCVLHEISLWNGDLMLYK
jgi:hypothetical protein